MNYMMEWMRMMNWNIWNGIVNKWWFVMKEYVIMNEMMIVESIDKWMKVYANGNCYLERVWIYVLLLDNDGYIGYMKWLYECMFKKNDNS